MTPPIPLIFLILACFVEVDAYTFAVIPKRTNNPFFTAVKEGCMARAKQIDNVTCVFAGPDDQGPNATKRQIEIAEELLPQLDGFAIAVMDKEAISPVIAKAVKAGVNVVTFDSDAEESERSAYVGTDNRAFGRELAHVLLQLSPEGGTFGIVGGSFPHSPNLWERIVGIREGLKRSGWIEVSNSPVASNGDSLLALEQMEILASTNPGLGAIIPVGGWPMWNATEWKSFVARHPEVTTVCADAFEVQIQLMNEGAADGLVGQLPFRMGELAIDKLLVLKQRQEQGLDPPFAKGKSFATSVLNVLQIPQDLPPLEEDMNYIGNLSIFGWVLCGIIVVVSVACMIWTFVYRENRVVQASQPAFLVMICVGTIIMGSAIIPLSLDDEKISLSGCSIACKCIPWLLCIGFTTTFSALFSKTWRVNKLYREARHFRKVQVSVRDVSIPFAVLLTLNVAVLVCWTLIAPLQFERRAHSGTDNWNRVSRSYYGACFSPSDSAGGALPYVVTLAVINLGVIVVANVQACQARRIHTAFSESRYIAFIMVALLQAWVMGIPILVLVGDSPQATFVVATVLIFATCMATLLFLFVPKIFRSQKKPRRTSSIASSLPSSVEEIESSRRRSSVTFRGSFQREVSTNQSGDTFATSIDGPVVSDQVENGVCDQC